MSRSAFLSKNSPVIYRSMLSFSSSTAYTVASNPIPASIRADSSECDQIFPESRRIASDAYRAWQRNLSWAGQTSLFVEVVELWYFVVCSLGVEEGRPSWFYCPFFLYLSTPNRHKRLYISGMYSFRKENMRATSVCHTKHGNARCVDTFHFQSKTPCRWFKVPRNPKYKSSTARRHTIRRTAGKLWTPKQM
jgi:hypothetical protein